MVEPEERARSRSAGGRGAGVQDLRRFGPHSLAQQVAMEELWKLLEAGASTRALEEWRLERE
eukprot:11956541-Alexandrium_andersonii.AAC.1